MAYYVYGTGSAVSFTSSCHHILGHALLCIHSGNIQSLPSLSLINYYRIVELDFNICSIFLVWGCNICTESNLELLSDIRWFPTVVNIFAEKYNITMMKANRINSFHDCLSTFMSIQVHSWIFDRSAIHGYITPCNSVKGRYLI